MVGDLFKRIEAELSDLEDKALKRHLRGVQRREGPRVWVQGKELVLFCSNDYLGLSTDPRVKEAAIDAVKRWGTGAGASRLISGNLGLYERLEEIISDFKGTEEALVFSTGYATNLGVITSLCREGDIIFSDGLNHASIVDACRLSRAKVEIYPHCELDYLEKRLAQVNGSGNRFIVTDGVFSMDGDLCPLPGLVTLAKRYCATIILDDAHATGILGPSGGGSLDYWGISHGDIIQVGTFSKAIGTLGGFVACPRVVKEYLVNRARPLIYSTGLPPAVLGATIKAFEIIKAEPLLRHRLLRLCTLFRDGINRLGFSIPPLPTPIFPLILGDEKEAIALSNYLYKEGIFVPAIRPPTVPKGQSRLRISVSASHLPEDIERLLDLIALFFKY